MARPRRLPFAWSTGPQIGAVAAVWSNLARKDRARWLELILRSGAQLLILAVIVVLLLPSPSTVRLDRKGLASVLVIYGFYILALAVIARRFQPLYEKTAIRLSRILISTVLISLLVWFSSGDSSYFWFFYSLPLLQATLYLRVRGLIAVATVVVAAYWSTCAAVAASSGLPLDLRLLLMNTFALAIQVFTFYWLFGSVQARRLTYEEMEALQRTALDIGSQLKLDILLRTIIDRALSLLGATGGGIYLADAQRQELKVVSDLGGKHSIVGHTLKIGEGMAGRVFADGLPMIVPDYSRWEHRSSDLEPDLFQAVVEVPLGIPSKQLLGVLYVTDRGEGRIFTERDVKLLSLLASHATIAIHNARAFEQLAMLNRVNEQIRLLIGVDDILQVVLQEALRAVHTDEGSVMTLEGNRLEIKAWVVRGQFAPSKSHRSFGLDEGIAGWVASTATPYNCPDVLKDPYFVPSPDDRPIRSLLSVPVVSHGKVICVLNADNEKPGYFQPDDVRLLTLLAGHLALAMETQRLRDVGIFLSTHTVDELCAKIVASACLLTSTESSSIFLLDPKSSELRLAATYPPGRPTATPRPDGLTMSVIRSGQTLKIDDVQTDSRVQAAIKHSGVRSLLCSPLCVRTGAPDQPVKTIGALFVRTHEPRLFRRRDEELLQSLANQAAIAIENTRIRADLEEHVQFLESLVASASDAIIAVNDHGIVTGLNTAAETILGVSRDELLGEHVERVYYDKGAAREVKRLLVEGGGRLIDYESAVRNKDGARIPIRLSANLLPGGSVGFFGDLRKVIEGARRHIAQLERLLEAVQSITRLDDIDSVLRKAAAQTIEALGADAVALHLYDEGRQEWLGAVRLPETGPSSGDAMPEPLEVVERILERGKISYPEGSTDSNTPWSEDRHGAFQASVACPLVVGERTVGLLLFHYRTERLFSDEDRAIIHLFADVVAIVIENARLYQESKVQADQFQTLYQASFDLTADLDMESALQKLVEGGRQLTRARYGALGIIGSSGALHPFITSGLTPEEREGIGPPPVGRGILGQLLEVDQILNLQKISDHHRFSSWPPGHPEITSFLGVPIVMKGRPIGNLYMANKDLGRPFSHRDEVGLRTLAAQAANFIERLRAHEEASALSTMNVAFLVLSHWAHLVQQKWYALNNNLDTLRKALPVELFEDELRNMELTIRDLQAPGQELQDEVAKGLNERIDLSTIIESVGEARCRLKMIKVRPTYDLDPGSFVYGHRLLLEFAVSMVVENAVKAVLARKQPGELHLQCRLEPSLVRVTITDSGIGVSPQIQSDLYRVPVRSERGFGHGAVAARMVLKAHKGDIRLVESTSRGTKVEFWIPAADRAEKPQP